MKAAINFFLILTALVVLCYYIPSFGEEYTASYWLDKANLLDKNGNRVGDFGKRP